MTDRYYRSPVSPGHERDPGLTSEQIRWLEIAGRVAVDALQPMATQIDREGSFPQEAVQAFAASGLLSLVARKADGGGEADAVTVALTLERLASECASSAMVLMMHLSAAALVAALSEDDQADQLKAIVKESALLTYATSEPGSGPRWWHMDGYSEKTSEGYVIEATKSFATSAGHANFYVVPVRASRWSSPQELTIFLVPSEASGVQPIGSWDGLGLRGNSSTPVEFKRCVVKPSCRLGASGYGLPLLLAYGLPIFQVGVASVYSGIAQSAIRAAVDHASRRILPDIGKPLASDVQVQRRLAEMKLRTDQARALLLRGARLVDSWADRPLDALDDQDFFLTLAEVKVASCEAAIAVTNMAMQVCGGTGYKRGHPAERCFRDARAGSLMGPDDDSLKWIIGRRMLGLPFPWTDESE